LSCQLKNKNTVRLIIFGLACAKIQPKLGVISISLFAYTNLIGTCKGDGIFFMKKVCQLQQLLSTAILTLSSVKVDKTVL